MDSESINLGSNPSPAAKMLNKIIKLSLIVILVFALIILAKIIFQRKESWEFVGYQYKWDENYVDNSGLKSEKECVNYGNEWLRKQQSADSLFTCSNNCKDAGFGNGMVVCDKVCEYGKSGLVQCRK